MQEAKFVGKVTVEESFGMRDSQQATRLNKSFAQFLSQRTALQDKQKLAFESLIADLSFQLDQGNNCIQINAVERELVWNSGLISEHNIAPLKLENDRLYLYRYWFYENRLARQIHRLRQQRYAIADFETLLNRYFVELSDEIDWQKEAALKVLMHAVCLITGGPGTGKTTTVVKILALLQELASGKGQSLQMAVAAPTGKAANRLQEAINSHRQALPCSDQIIQQIPQSVYTLHRLLGAQPSSPCFKHDAENPLIYDVVVVDEASMVDLALMSKLVDALKPKARLILLGDKDQLASVESGSVLADLISGLPEQVVELKKSYRFQGEIKRLAEAVNAQAVEQAWSILQNGQQVGLLESSLIEFIVGKYLDYLQLIEKKADFVSIFAAFNRFKVLCSNRFGAGGVVDLNRRIEQRLIQSHKIKKNGVWYPGRPVMMLQNNERMRLYNGDIGICLWQDEGDRLAVFFLRSDGGLKKILPNRIPKHETVFAMTIHKSQGSEFDECLCVLPEVVNPVLSKELLYTAITRAKKHLKIYASKIVFGDALQQKINRKGGLLEKLQG